MNYSQQPPNQPQWPQVPQRMFGPPMAPPPPPAPPQKSTSKTVGLGCLGIFAFVILAGIVAGALDGDDDKDAKATSKASASATQADDAADASDDKPAGLDKRTITRVSVDATWDSYTEEQKDELCLGIDLYSENWFANQLKSDNIDSNYAAERVSAKCDAH
ncbi:hypothetical protein [Streptomyces sp. NPDC095817]|uniref:hypothetical protein n=1 Tax=Streptomyces sp. NPDC095817 TaxID=3155082 RepID=UPI0033345772